MEDLLPADLQLRGHFCSRVHNLANFIGILVAEKRPDFFLEREIGLAESDVHANEFLSLASNAA